MDNSNYLKNHLLIAMPRLMDPNFHKSVTYIYEHNEEGALGIVINKPMRLTLGDVMRHLKISIQDPNIDQYPVLLGGPVAQEQGFIILPTQHYNFKEEPIEELLAENDEIVVSSSKSLLQTIAQGSGPQDLIISLGYSGWGAGQLEEEIANNSWLVAPFHLDILFKTPFEKRWHAAAASIGVDLNRLANDAGHA